MRLTDEAQEAVEFGRFRLLPHRRELRADGVAVELGSRAFDVLMVLTEARGALVTKDEIMARVWPETVVEENNLVVQISALRRALGEDRDFIRTVSGLGYRFIAEIRNLVADPSGETGLEPGVAPDADALIDQLWSAIELLPVPEPQPDPKRPSKHLSVPLVRTSLDFLGGEGLSGRAQGAPNARG
jgi:DNA-binding winged helix-turn-helix (wHTH) protein